MKFQRKFLLIAFVLDTLLLHCSATVKDDLTTPVPLRNAHAHNDYDHPRPLWDALEHGFTSIEVDIFLRNDSLYVAHDPEDITPTRTLQRLYLNPLYKLYQHNNGAIYSGWPTLYLMIDVKSDADSTYRVLRLHLSAFADMLTRWQDGQKYEKAVTIILSGNRPIDAVSREHIRFVAIDGRLDDLHHNRPADVFPWISENWTDIFTWRGIGEMPADEREKLASIVHHAHQNGRLVRFWATDIPSPSARYSMWKTLYNANIDLINTDDLGGLADFLHSQK